MQLNVKEKSYIEYYLPFYLLLSQYKFGVFTLGEIGLIFVAIIQTINNGMHAKLVKIVYKDYIWFLAYIIVRDVLNAIIGPDNTQTEINRMSEYIFVFILVFIVCSNGFCEDKLYRTWKIAGAFFLGGLLYHLVLLHVFHREVMPISIIPGYLIQAEEYVAANRPSSFFSEPAAFVNAMIPLLFISIRKRDIKWAVIITFAIVASTSTAGILLAGFLWLLLLFSTNLSSKKKALITVLGVFLIFIITITPIFSDSLLKLQEVLSGGSTVGSRIIVGFEVIKSLNKLELIFGTLYNEVMQYISSNIGRFIGTSMTIRYYRFGGVFLNTFAQLIFRYGIVGLVLFFSTIRRKIFNPSYKGRDLAFVMLVAIMGQTMLLNAYYFEMTMLLILYSWDWIEEESR